MLLREKLLLLYTACTVQGASLRGARETAGDALAGTENDANDLAYQGARQSLQRRLEDGHFVLDPVHLKTICAGCPMRHDASKPVDTATRAAALAALQLQGKKDGKKLDLVKIVSFTTQVVAGIIYKLTLQVKHHGAPAYTRQRVEARVLSQAWRTPKFVLLSFKDETETEGHQQGGGGSF